MICSGDTAWVLISSALVLLMTPGVAFFYAGMVSTRCVINTLNMSFICFAVIPILWVLVGFSLVFSEGNGFIGSLKWLAVDQLMNKSSNGVLQEAFMVYQMMFAVITPALISGAIVGRMKFKAYVIFIALWNLLIYIPIAHWVWGPDGWIHNLGAIDFAGGTVVHINAGFAAITAAMILGPRLTLNGATETQPHNIPFVILGASLLWFGWYGFNAGSALAANGLASLAFLTTTLAPAASILVWTILSWLRKSNSTAVGKATSAVIGLVAITPAAGYVTPLGAIFIGGIAAIICYFIMVYRKSLLGRIDDSLDVFICHGISGVVGSLLTGIFATKTVNILGADGLLYGNPTLLWKQAIAVFVVLVFSIIGTTIILYVLKLIMPIRASKEDELIGIDKTEHGEKAYKSGII